MQPARYLLNQEDPIEHTKTEPETVKRIEDFRGEFAVAGTPLAQSMRHFLEHCAPSSERDAMATLRGQFPGYPEQFHKAALSGYFRNKFMRR